MNKIENLNETVVDNSDFTLKKTSAWLIILVVIGMLTILTLIIWLNNKQTSNTISINTDTIQAPGSQIQKNAEVSGKVILTSLVPNNGEIRILHRIHNQGEYVDTGLKLSPMKTLDFLTEKAISGQNYDLRADYYVNNELIARSLSTTVTAPAYNVELELAIKQNELQSCETGSQDLALSGKVIVNGYIPIGAKLEIYDLSQSMQQQTQSQIYNNMIWESTEVGAAQKWEWQGILASKTYELDAVLKNKKGEIIGIADHKIACEAADSNVNFIINSLAQPELIATVPAPTPTPTPQVISPPVQVVPPSTKAKISGKIDLNGPIAPNSSIIILYKNPGEADFKVAYRINEPQNKGQMWEWNEAEIGQQYEMAVALQVNEQNTSSAQSQTVAAPAQNVNFTLNTNFFVPTPSEKPYLESCSNRDGEMWQANLVIPYQVTAGNYAIQVGEVDKVNNENSLPNIYNQNLNVSGQTSATKLTVRVKGNKAYYVRYAMSYCIKCSDKNNFSPWSRPTEFTCFN